MPIRAIQYDRTGGPDVFREVSLPDPSPGPGEAVVRHDAIGVNFVDVYQRSGLYKVELPAVPGTEGAGVVVAVGAGVSTVAVGDRVGYVARTPGSYATARVVEASALVRLPDSIDGRRGAAMMLKGLTVQYLLRQLRVDLRPGDPIVWHAAAGGVGTIACQWANALGYRVIATAGGADKCARALAHGAAYAIDYTKEDVVARVRELTGGAGVKVVYDSVGKDTWERSIACLAPQGLMVSYGNASGPVPPISLLPLTSRALYVVRPSLGVFTAPAGALAKMAGELFDMVTSGKVVVEAPREYALADAAQAHRDLEGRVTTGACVLVA
jgi:NADPH2:quinone reductase